MLDTKSRLILSILAQETKNGNYKIFELQDIIMSLPKHYRMDRQNVRNILFFLERQDIISIKYDEDDTFCLCVLPYGFVILENEKPSKIPLKNKKNNPTANYAVTFVLSFLGAFFGVLIGIFLFK